MNNYSICHKIRSLVDLFGHEIISGFDIRPYDQSSDGYLLGRKNIVAPNFHEAYKSYVEEIETVLDALSVFNQSAISIIGNSFLVEKIGSPHFYFYFARPTKTVGMSYLTEDIDKIQTMMNSHDRMALIFMRQVNNTNSPYTRLALLLVVVESLAGTLSAQACSNEDCPNSKIIYKKTNNNELKNILGGKLFEKFYVGDQPIRHRLFHGHKIKRDEFVSSLEDIYDRVIDYYNKHYKLEITKIKNGPRAFDDSYEGGRFFLEKTDTFEIDFVKLERDFDQTNGLPMKNDQGYKLVTDPGTSKQLLKEY